MRRAPWITLGLVAAFVATAAAQEPVDSEDTTGAELLRAEIERRFAERVKIDLGLSDDQMNKLKATQERVGPRRRQLFREMLGYQLALRRQMQPGIAANPDSVRVYMDGVQRVRGAQLALDQEEDREWTRYLTPVQRARLHIMRQRLIDRVNELRQGRQQGRLGGQRPIQRPPRARPLGPRRRP